MVRKPLGDLLDKKTFQKNTTRVEVVDSKRKAFAKDLWPGDFSKQKRHGELQMPGRVFWEVVEASDLPIKAAGRFVGRVVKEMGMESSVWLIVHKDLQILSLFFVFETLLFFFLVFLGVIGTI